MPDVVSLALDPLNREVFDEMRRVGGFSSDDDLLRYACYRAGDFLLGASMPVSAFELPYRPEMRRVLELERQAAAAAARALDGDDAQAGLFDERTSA